MELSYQLYTSRNFPLEETLRALADNGITNVEGYDPLYADPKALAKQLEGFGLSMPTGHMGIIGLETNFDGMMKAADALGIEVIIAPYLAPEDRPKDKKGWLEFGERLAVVADRVVASGREFAWHNHDFEFIPFPDNSLPIDAILAGSSDIQAELDLAWIRVADRDPAAELKRLGGRTLAVHLKDIAPMGENTDQDGWTNVGEGTMDYEAVSLLINDTGARYKVIEHDLPKDPIVFIERSVARANEI